METIDVVRDFSKYPGGRYANDGPYSAETFRKNILVPALKKGVPFCLDLDGAAGYAASFLEEVFGGLIREEGFTREQIFSLLNIESEDASLVYEILEYIDDESRRHLK